MELRPQLLQLLRTKDYVPMRREEIFAILKIGSKEIAAADSLLDEMLERGEVARLKKDKLCIPDDADLVSGRIMFRQNGAATLIPDSSTGKPSGPGAGYPVAVETQESRYMPTKC